MKHYSWSEVSECCSSRNINVHVINPRRACAARVTVVVLSFCLSVCLSLCLSVTTFSAVTATRRPISDSNGFSATLALFKK